MEGGQGKTEGEDRRQGKTGGEDRREEGGTVKMASILISIGYPLITN